MENINFILCIVYFGLSILNIFGLTTISNSDIFAMTVGGLFLCIAPLIDNKNLKKFIYIIAVSFLVGFRLIKGSNEIVKNIDNNIWMLLSLSVTFLSNYLSHLKVNRLELEKREEKLKENKLLKQQLDILKYQINNKNDK